MEHTEERPAKPELRDPLQVKHGIHSQGNKMGDRIRVRSSPNIQVRDRPCLASLIAHLRAVYPCLVVPPNLAQVAEKSPVGS